MVSRDSNKGIGENIDYKHENLRFRDEFNKSLLPSGIKKNLRYDAHLLMWNRMIIFIYHKHTGAYPCNLWSLTDTTALKISLTFTVLKHFQINGSNVLYIIFIVSAKSKFGFSSIADIFQNRF